MSRFPQPQLFRSRTTANAPTLASALDAFWERMMGMTELDLTNVISLAEDERFHTVRSGSPERWKELWDKSADDPHLAERFDNFVDLAPLHDRLADRGGRIRRRA